METTRTCRSCNVEKSINDYYKDRQESPNYLRKFKDCKECSNKRERTQYKSQYQTKNRKRLSENQIHRHQKKKQKAVDLFNNECLDCKQSYPLCVYDFHHLDPKEKDKSPSQLWGHKWERIKQELNKCVLLCANCHRKRHFV